MRSIKAQCVEKAFASLLTPHTVATMDGGNATRLYGTIFAAHAGNGCSLVKHWSPETGHACSPLQVNFKGEAAAVGPQTALAKLTVEWLQLLLHCLAENRHTAAECGIV